MRDRPREEQPTVKSSSGRMRAVSSSRVRSIFAGVVLAAVICAIGLSMAAVPGHGRFEFAVAAGAILFFAMQIPAREAEADVPPPAANEDLKQIFASAGPMVIGIGLNGVITHFNPAAERLLGYHAEELVGTPNTSDILAPGEAPRLIAELQRLGGVEKKRELSPLERLAALMHSVRALPPSQVPSFEALLRRKDGTTLPVTLHISALRTSDGTMQGLVVVALDRSATLRQEQAARESQERYRDLFENSSEMIATLSTAGQFLYANPSWKRSFGLDTSNLLALNSFEELFGPGCRSEVAGLFRRVL